MSNILWHRVVKADNSRIIDMVDHFENELIEARKEVKQVGVIETIVQKLPSYLETRFSQLQEIETVLEIMEIEMRKLESEKYKMFLENYKRQLSSSDVKKYIDGDSEVVALSELIVEVAYIRNQYTSVVKALEAKGFALGHVVKLRTAGIEDSTIS